MKVRINHHLKNGMLNISFEGKPNERISASNYNDKIFDAVKNGDTYILMPNKEQFHKNYCIVIKEAKPQTELEYYKWLAGDRDV